MKLERYLTKEGAERLDYFGEHFEESSWDFDWYFADQNIGISGNPSTEAECFIGGLLVRKDDALIITPSKTSPKIQRRSESYGVISGNDGGGVALISPLVELLQQDIVHLFYTSAKEDGNPWDKILTFSPNTPKLDSYNKGTSMEIILEPEVDYEAMFQRIARK